MNPLTNPAIIKHIMERHGIVFNKKFGQIFLIADSVLTDIIDYSGVTKDDCVLEIGPGIGALTVHLATASKKVVSVEIDNGLIPVLDETLAEHDNTQVINNDILKTDIPALIDSEYDGQSQIVIANLPYYITSPILMSLLESEVQFKKIVVMVQKEVAERLSSEPGSKDYGIVTIATNFHADTKKLLDVPRNCFMPAPNVDSAIIELVPRKHPTCNPTSTDMFFRTVKAAFAQRRKTLINSMCKSGFFSFSKKDIENAIINSGLSPAVRGETLTLDEFAVLSYELCKLT